MVTSAALLLREQGVAGTSVAKVLEHCDGPRGSVTFHFPRGRIELLTEALRSVSNAVTERLHRGTAEGTSAAEIVDGMIEHYRAGLLASDFTAGCPVGATAQEAYADPELGPLVRSITNDWLTALEDALVRGGHGKEDATELATMGLCAVEGAITLARVQRSVAPLEAVRTRILPLLSEVRANRG